MDKILVSIIIFALIRFYVTTTNQIKDLQAQIDDQDMVWKSISQLANNTYYKQEDMIIILSQLDQRVSNLE